MRWICLLLCLSTLPAFGFLEEIPIGGKVPNLEFKDIRYLPLTVDDLGKPKAYVFAFITNTCPLARRYLPRIGEMAKDFAPRGVQFVGVNVGPADTLMDVAYHALEFDVDFPMVKDMTGDAVGSLGITRTPEIVLLDADRVLRYRGRVDDQYRLGGVKPTIGREDLRLAIEEVLADTPVEVPETQSEGCSITFLSTPDPSELVTYSGHVATVIDQHCLPCHREGGGAPFAFDTYDRVAARADMISEVVSEERMPPWYAHPEFGDFSNDRRLRADERRVILQWARTGKAEGPPEMRPPLPEFPDGEWRIEADLILEAPQPIPLPAEGFVDYQYVLLDHVFEQDTWVQGLQILAGNTQVLHHANLFYRPAEGPFKRSQHFLTGIVPGGMPTNLEDGVAMLIPKRATLGLQVHYVTTGKPEFDRPRVGIRFAKEPIRKHVRYKILDEDKFEIPPGVARHRVAAEAVIEEKATVLALFGHMHLRGRDMTFNAVYPEGNSDTLLSMPNYSFDWQLSYYPEPGSMRLPEGTRIECIAHFDNSALNPYNPDPGKTITYGPQTVDEMMQGFVFYTIDDENLELRVDPATGWALSELAQVSRGAAR